MTKLGEGDIVAVQFVISPVVISTHINMKQSKIFTVAYNKTMEEEDIEEPQFYLSIEASNRWVSALKPQKDGSSLRICFLDTIKKKF